MYAQVFVLCSILALVSYRCYKRECGNMLSLFTMNMSVAISQAFGFIAVEVFEDVPSIFFTNLLNLQDFFRIITYTTYISFFMAAVWSYSCTQLNYASITVLSLPTHIGIKIMHVLNKCKFNKILLISSPCQP